MEQFSLTYRCS